MSRWACFNDWSQDSRRIHVLPVGRDGDILMPHVAHESCQCHWRRDDVHHELIIHEDRERGGTNG